MIMCLNRLGKIATLKLFSLFVAIDIKQKMKIKYKIAVFFISLAVLLLWYFIYKKYWLVWNIMEYCSDWQVIEWLEMIDWKVIYSKWDYVVVKWYYQRSDLNWTWDCEYNELWNLIWCRPNFRYYDTWYKEEVFLKKNCIRRDSIGKYKDMIRNVKIYEEEQFTFYECRQQIKKDWLKANYWSKNVIYFDVWYFNR